MVIEQESELLIDPKSLTMPIEWIERENKEVRIPQGDSKPKRERQRTFSSRAMRSTERQRMEGSSTRTSCPYPSSHVTDRSQKQGEVLWLRNEPMK